MGRIIFLNRYWGLLILIAASLIPLITLLNPGLPITHDGKDHVARIANFYLALSDGIFIPRWGALLNWGYGHPVLMFLYPLSSYLASFFHLLGFSFTDSVKMVFASAFIASGIFMYLWARNVFGEYGGVTAGLLYMYAPYRFVDIYVRGAIGEHMAFVFPPLVLYFLLKLSKKSSFWNSDWYVVGGAVSFAGLILAHNALAIMFLPFIIFYAVYLVVGSKSKALLSTPHSGQGLLILYLLIAILGFGLSAFFLIPAFMEGKYTLRDIVTGEEYRTRFIDPLKLIYSRWNYGITGQFSIHLGWVQLAGLLILPFTLLKLFKERKNHMAFFLLITLIFFNFSIFIMLPQSQFLYDAVTTFKKFQFPWRFLSLSVFTTSIIGAGLFLLVKKELYRKVLLVLVLFTLLLSSYGQWKAKDYLNLPDSFYTSAYESTTDTGESSPIWSVRFMEKRPQTNGAIIEGDGRIENVLRTTNKHVYTVNIDGNKARILDNTVYFPGWKVYVDGEEVPVEFQDQLHRGLITYFVPQGKHNVTVVFEETKLRKFSNILSIVSVLFLLGIGVFIYVKKRFV